MSIDEGAHVHEIVIKMLKDELVGSVLIPNQTILYAVFFPLILLCLIAFMTKFLRFLRHLPRTTLWLSLGSGTVYVTGALLIEMISQIYAVGHGKQTPIYGGLATIEEFMEMLGIALYIYTLLDYLRSLAVDIRIDFIDHAQPCASFPDILDITPFAPATEILKKR